jgi:hypothetical protein
MLPGSRGASDPDAALLLAGLLIEVRRAERPAAASA